MRVSAISFGSRITGDYSKVEEISRQAGYPEVAIGRINSRLRALFPDKKDELRFVYKTETVMPRVDGGPFYQDGVTGVGKHIQIKDRPYSVLEKDVLLIRDGKVVASERIKPVSLPPKMFEILRLKYGGIGYKSAAVYEAELASLSDRRLVFDYFMAAVRIAKKIRK